MNLVAIFSTFSFLLRQTVLPLHYLLSSLSPLPALHFYIPLPIPTLLSLPIPHFSLPFPTLHSFSYLPFVFLHFNPPFYTSRLLPTFPSSSSLPLLLPWPRSPEQRHPDGSNHLAPPLPSLRGSLPAPPSSLTRGTGSLEVTEAAVTPTTAANRRLQISP